MPQGLRIRQLIHHLSKQQYYRVLKKTNHKAKLLPTYDVQMNLK